jgi:hypothetical protein
MNDQLLLNQLESKQLNKIAKHDALTPDDMAKMRNLFDKVEKRQAVPSKKQAADAFKAHVAARLDPKTELGAKIHELVPDKYKAELDPEYGMPEAEQPTDRPTTSPLHDDAWSTFEKDERSQVPAMKMLEDLSNWADEVGVHPETVEAVAHDLLQGKSREEVAATFERLQSAEYADEERVAHGGASKHEPQPQMPPEPDVRQRTNDRISQGVPVEEWQTRDNSARSKRVTAAQDLKARNSQPWNLMGGMWNRRSLKWLGASALLHAVGFHHVLALFLAYQWIHGAMAAGGNLIEGALRSNLGQQLGRSAIKSMSSGAGGALAFANTQANLETMVHAALFGGATRAAVQLTASGGGLKAALGAGDKQMSATETMQKVQALASQPEVLQQRAHAAFAPVHSAAPGSAHLAAQSVQNTVAYLNSIVPKANTTDPFAPPFQPSISDQRKFMDAVEVADDPFAALRHVRDGTATAQHIDALKNCAPTLYQMAVAQAGSAIAASQKDGANVSPRQRAQLMELIGMQQRPAPGIGPPPPAPQKAPAQAQGGGKKGKAITYNKMPSDETTAQRAYRGSRK